MQRGAPLVALAIAACGAPPSSNQVTDTAVPVGAVAPAPRAPASGSIVPAAYTVSASASPIPSLPATCVPIAGDRVAFFVSPRAPRAGVPVRLVAHSEQPIEGELSIVDASGAEIVGSRERHGGPPFFWVAELRAPVAGAYRAALRTRDGLSCNEFTVAETAPRDDPRVSSAWPVRAAWDRAAERLYSAWIERLFDAPTGADLTFPALHEVLRDPARNLLHDYLGRGEDDAGPHALVIDPDCADLPYFLRAYFAHKLGLPFGFSSCTRGGAGQPPSCRRFHTNLEASPQRSTESATFGDFLRVTLADTVHSGTGRTPADQDTGDYYSVPISSASLRPGTVYADPYGHVLVIAKRIPQTERGGGVLYAVDGQPDATISRRRFWRGNFLFALDPALGSPGWKRFRPVVVEARGRARALGNAEIAASPDYGDLSLAQYGAGVEGFYDAMDDVLSPAPLDPAQALGEALAALEEQVRGRVISVGNAKKHFAAAGGRIDMPEGSAIFETTGPWEDFSTPSRDLRLLIAVDVVRGFPDRVARRPERFAMPAGRAVPEVKRALEQQLAEELGKRSFAYERSDGSSFTLSLADVVARAADLEMAYNPNDCPEVRWGAPAGSEEAKPCSRRAPGSQTARMRKVRAWFHERRRPPRG
ncbi:Hypothetical protein A7982_12740 [Minicystis rosea]|nr:Hypothetical protein A7982_12740 [Minicystis rosea]